MKMREKHREKYKLTGSSNIGSLKVLKKGSFYQLLNFVYWLAVRDLEFSHKIS